MHIYNVVYNGIVLGLISAILAAIVSFGAGAANLGNLTPQMQTQSIVTNTNSACYNPQLNVSITLRWPENYVNVSDNRAAFNPNLFSSTSPFNSDVMCQNLVMADNAERKFILVREDVRISSCKTDELAGPLGKGSCPGFEGLAVDQAGSQRHRGSCDINGYTDLRKIADVNKDGKILEIFWNPYSYNVGCNYQQDENCGPGQRRNINLKDFVYVLRGRDASNTDSANPGKPAQNSDCPVQWDAGSTNFDACSHHFDVYMAEDLYKASKSAPATNDPENPYYFIKQVLENCQEKTQFIPAPEADLTVPPLFIKSPFIWQNDTTIYAEKKIVAGTSEERLNYLTYIYTFPDVFYDVKTASTLNLVRLPTDEIAGPLKLCPGTTINTLAVTVIPTPTLPANRFMSDCYDSLGMIILKDEKGQNTKFQAFSKKVSPQTFTLVRQKDTTKGYVYTITNKDYPSNERNDKSLQFRAMQMIQRNMWTWATPWCKPAIYMYPEKTTNINVKLDLDGQLTVSNPNYDSQNGWSVVAQPDGKISEPLTLSDYPYLYYEADLKGVTIPKEGWVVKGTNDKDSRVSGIHDAVNTQNIPTASGQISKTMKEIGFNAKETSDFMNYWLPRLTEKPYYFVTLLPEEVINQKEKLTFSINPDSLIRSRFVFEGLDAPISVKPLNNIQSHQRNGFTVADWGGTIVGKSCTDITVK